MTTSYFIVTKWQGEKIINSNDAITFALIRRAEVRGAEARFYAAKYAKELNRGFDFTSTTGRGNLIMALKNDLEYYTVCAIPDSQAREYNNYLSWENCEVYIPK